MHRHGEHRFERIGAVQLKDRKIRIGIVSCAVVTVFPKTVVDDHPMLQTPSKAKSFMPASSKLLPDLGARKVQVKLGDGSLRYVNQRVADAHRALMAVSEMNDMGHNVFCPKSHGHQGVCVPRGQWHKTGARESEWSFRVANRACAMRSEYFQEQHFRSLLFTFGAATDRGYGQDCESKSPKLIGACSAVSPTEETHLEPLVVEGCSGSRDVMIYPILGGGLLEEGPVRREVELQRQVESDAAQRPVVKKAPSAPSLDGWDAHLAAGRDHGRPELHLDYTYVGREADKLVFEMRSNSSSFLSLHQCIRFEECSNTCTRVLAGDFLLVMLRASLSQSLSANW